MYRTVALFFAFVALAVCASKSYTITLFNSTTIGGAELKPGEYKVKVLDQNTVMIDGKPDTKTVVKTETVKEKFGQTSVRVSNSDGKSRLQEIRLGGTNTKLVIAEPSTNAGN